MTPVFAEYAECPDLPGSGEPKRRHVAAREPAPTWGRPRRGESRRMSGRRTAHPSPSANLAGERWRDVDQGLTPSGERPPLSAVETTSGTPMQAHGGVMPLLFRAALKAESPTGLPTPIWLYDPHPPRWTCDWVRVSRFTPFPGSRAAAPAPRPIFGAAAVP